MYMIEIIIRCERLVVNHTMITYNIYRFILYFHVNNKNMTVGAEISHFQENLEIQALNEMLDKS